MKGKKSLNCRHILNLILCVETSLLAGVALYFLARVFICDSFTIRGSSMEPTFHNGQKVRVFKPLIGPRIYTSFDFGDGRPLECFRLKGFRRLRPGDIAVFNSPEGQGAGRIGFRLNYVYAKRCLGVAGDTILIKDGRYICSGCTGHVVPESSERLLQSVPDSVLARTSCLAAGFFAGESDRWTIKNMGPVVIPFKGMKVPLDSLNVARYSMVMEFETGSVPVPSAERSYVFRQNYCFFVGDNTPDSRDSRYFGFVPEDYVIGVVL